jgi:tetratricopeptide (TPR) repeat protein
MRVRLGLAIFCTAAIIGAAAWWFLARPVTVADPPSPRENIAFDPAVAQLIERAIAAAKQSPHEAQPRVTLAMIYHANGLADLAEQTYQQALAQDDDNARVWHYLARLQAEQGDVAAALANMDQSIELDGAHASSHWRRGFWLLDDGRIADAADAFGEAISIDVNDAAGRVGLARTMMESRRYEEAARELEELLRRQPPPPNVPYVRQLLGTAYRQLGMINVAQTELAGIGGVDVTWPDAWAAELSTHRAGYAAMIERAAGLLASGRTDDAMKLINDTLRQRPGDVTALNYLAQAHMSQSRPDDAIDALRKALLSDPDHGGTLINLSLAFEAKDQLDQALAQARQAVKANPMMGPAHLQLGRVLALRDDLDGAVESLTSAIRLGVSDPQTRIMLGQFLLEQRNWSEAGRVLEQAVLAAPDSAAAHVALARASMEQGALSEAASLLQRARQMDPHERSLADAQQRLEQLQSGAAAGASAP